MPGKWKTYLTSPLERAEAKETSQPCIQHKGNTVQAIVACKYSPCSSAWGKAHFSFRKENVFFKRSTYKNEYIFNTRNSIVCYCNIASSLLHQCMGFLNYHFYWQLASLWGHLSQAFLIRNRNIVMKEELCWSFVICFTTFPVFDRFHCCYVLPEWTLQKNYAAILLFVHF